MEDQNVQTVISKKEDELESVPGEMPALDLTEQELFERKAMRIKEVAARVEVNLNKPVR
jgi:hypothetical protein